MSLAITVPLNYAGDFEGIPYGAEWLGPWAMLEAHVETLMDVVQRVDLNVHLQQQAAAKAEGGSRKPDLMIGANGIATIPITGSLQKQRASLSRATSTVEARQLIRQAAADDNVKGIFLFVDSPGGTVAGTAELAADVAKAATQKPVYAAIEDLGASAAYWIASQATKVFVNATGRVGSIGTYAVVQDLRRVADARGITVHVVKAGEHKGTGTPGTEITAGQLAELQREVTALNEHFIAGVAAGRKLSIDQVRQLADGRVHVGAEAQKLKLVDAVANAEDIVAELVQLTSAPTKKGSPRMSDTTNSVQPKAATIQELKAEFPTASNDFIVAQASVGATLAHASKAFIAEQAKQIEAAHKAAADAKAKAEADAKALADAKAEADAKNKKPGNKPAAEGGKHVASEEGGDAVAEFGAAVQERMKSGMGRSAAIRAVAQAQPELHQSYLLATNPSGKANRQLTEKFGG